MDRFCWDWWHVPGQYTLLRTPAEAFFPAELYDQLEDALIAYGERELGCRGISPIWLRWAVASKWAAGPWRRGSGLATVEAVGPCAMACSSAFNATASAWHAIQGSKQQRLQSSYPLKHFPLTSLPCPYSCYVSGCHQGLHADAPHGPFAFVLSLTNWEERRFSGGETLLLQPHVLDYWRRFDSGVGTELPQLTAFCMPTTSVMMSVASPCPPLCGL